MSTCLRPTFFHSKLTSLRGQLRVWEVQAVTRDDALAPELSRGSTLPTFATSTVGSDDSLASAELSRGSTPPFASSTWPEGGPASGFDEERKPTLIMKRREQQLYQKVAIRKHRIARSVCVCVCVCVRLVRARARACACVRRRVCVCVRARARVARHFPLPTQHFLTLKVLVEQLLLEGARRRN